MTSEKSYDTAQRIEALMDGGWVSPYYVEKSADQGRGGQTLTADSELVLTVPTPATYLFRAYIIYKGGTGVSEGDLRFQMDTGGVGTLRYGPLRHGASFSHIIGDMMTAATTNFSSTNGLSNDNSLHLLGKWAVTATGPTSTLTFMWCKDVAADGTTNTTVEAHSFMALTRVV